MTTLWRATGRTLPDRLQSQVAFVDNCPIKQEDAAARLPTRVSGIGDDTMSRDMGTDQPGDQSQTPTPAAGTR